MLQAVKKGQWYERPEELIKPSALAKYLEENGYDVKDYTIRRNAESREYIEKLNSKIKEEELNFEKPIVYDTLDVDAFLKRNNNRNSLKNALIELDRSYAQIASQAAKAIKSNRELRAKVDKQEEIIATLTQQNEKLTAKITDGQRKEKDEIIRTLKRILDNYIYPSMGNAIIERELSDKKLIEVMGEVLTKDAIDANTLLADSSLQDCENLAEESSAPTDCGSSRFSSIDRIRAGFESGNSNKD